MASSGGRNAPDAELVEKLRALVARLTTELGIGEGRGAEGLATASVAMLSKMISPYDVTKVATAQAQKTLRERARDPEAFATAYDRLKRAGHASEVDKYLAVLAKVVADEDVLAAVSVDGGEEDGGAARGDDRRPTPRGATMLASSETTGDDTADFDFSRGAGVASEVGASPNDAEISSLSRDPPNASTGEFTFASEENALAADPEGRRSSPGMTGFKTMDGKTLTHNPAYSSSGGGGAGSGSGNGGAGAALADALGVMTPEVRRRMEGLDLGGAATPPAAARVRDSSRGEGEDAAAFAVVAARRAPGDALVEGRDFPTLPAWTSDRPFLTGSHLGSGAGGSSVARDAPKPLGEYDTACQELLVIDDLLYAMMGVEGRYVTASRSGGGAGGVVTFHISEGLEPSLRALAKEALPLCAAAATASDYAERARRFESGLVGHALAAEMSELLHDWHTMIVQLEHQKNLGRLSLQALWFYVQPAAPALALLARVAASAPGLRGAPLLNHLHREARARGGDVAARDLLLRLLRAAAAPYAKAVERWVYEGRVEDPYDEFLIVERADLDKASLSEEYDSRYWSARYTLREDVPVFLGGDLAEKVLTTGKYLTALRESTFSRGSAAAAGTISNAAAAAAAADDDDADAAAFDLPPLPSDGLGRIALGADARGTHATRINAAFKHASNALLRNVLIEGDLRARLLSMKRYFLLDKGDFLVHFVDIAGEQLSKRAPDISVDKLQSLLELSLKLSSASSDPHNEDLTCALERQGIIHQLLSIQSLRDDGTGAGGVAYDGDEAHVAMTPKEALRLTGFETFTLDYEAPWPVSLVLSRRALTKYQLLFRHMFHCKHVERRLCATWQTWQSSATRATATADAGSLGRAYILSQRMLHFLQNFVYYLACEVVEPNWHRLEAKIAEASNVDELAAEHDAFLDACMKEGMLFWPTILRRLEKIKSACLRFADASARCVLYTGSHTTPSPW
jgi:gamma-tubulin complex component 2